MCNSSSDCYNLGNYLSQSDLSSSGQNMLESNLKSYFWWKAQVSKLSRSLKKTGGYSAGDRKSATSARAGSSSTSSSKDAPQQRNTPEMSAALKRKDAQRGGGRGAPPTKRRRVRGGGGVGSISSGAVKSSTSQGGLFEAAMGANPEAFEEEAEKIARVYGTLSDPSLGC